MDSEGERDGGREDERERGMKRLRDGWREGQRERGMEGEREKGREGVGLLKCCRSAPPPSCP
jgi:hypothetical protein